MEKRRDYNRGKLGDKSRSRIESDSAQTVDNERKYDGGRKVFSYIYNDIGELSFTENEKGQEAL